MNRSRLTNAEVRVLYEGGASCPRIGALAGTSESAVRHRLHRLGVTMRTPQDYPAHVSEAHAARRGQVDPLSAREARARTRERLQLGTSALEDRLAVAFDAAGVTYIRQKAIGPYNVDFAVGALVIELSGGGHNPRVRANWPHRLAYLHEQGYGVLALTPRKHPNWIELALAAVDFVESET